MQISYGVSFFVVHHHCASTALQFMCSTSSLELNHCGYWHTEVCDVLVQYLTGSGNSDLRLNFILERTNNLGIASIDPKAHILFVHVTTEVEICLINEKNEVQELSMFLNSLTDGLSKATSLSFICIDLKL